MLELNPIIQWQLSSWMQSFSSSARLSLAQLSPSLFLILPSITSKKSLTQITKNLLSKTRNWEVAVDISFQIFHLTNCNINFDGDFGHVEFLPRTKKEVSEILISCSPQKLSRQKMRNDHCLLCRQCLSAISRTIKIKYLADCNEIKRIRSVCVGYQSPSWAIAGKADFHHMLHSMAGQAFSWPKLNCTHCGTILATWQHSTVHS